MEGGFSQIQSHLDLVEAGEKITGLLDVTEQQCRHLEELTRGQTFSKLWIWYHCGRITASHLYEVVCTDPHKPAVSLVTSFCLILSTAQNMVRSMKS